VNTWGRVRSLYRYPVKSLTGTRVEYLDLDERGCVGDRLWSVRTADNKIGSGKDTKRFAAVLGLLELRAAVDQDRVVVTFPDGSSYPVGEPAAADRLSEHFGAPLTFAKEGQVSHFDDGPVSMLGSASVEAIAKEQSEPVDPSRFRPNVFLGTDTPFIEETWVGGQVQVGTAVLGIALVSTRCVMVDMATADLPAQHGNLLATGRLNDTCLGVIARVVRPGRITIGDEVAVTEPGRAFFGGA
jgi:uncharacterized protein YcbX